MRGIAVSFSMIMDSVAIELKRMIMALFSLISDAAVRQSKTRSRRFRQGVAISGIPCRRGPTIAAIVLSQRMGRHFACLTECMLNQREDGLQTGLTHRAMRVVC